MTRLRPLLNMSKRFVNFRFKRTDSSDIFKSFMIVRENRVTISDLDDTTAPERSRILE